MTMDTLTQPQSRAARIAGLALLLSLVIVVAANFGVSFRLIVPNNAADTAKNILAHPTLFRLNIIADLVYVALQVGVLAGLYVILEPVDRTLALAAAGCRLAFAFLWGLAGVDMLGALRLLGDAAYLPVFRIDQLQTLARLHLAAGYDAYYAGLPFWALASTACAALWLRSRYIPKGLAIFGLLASAWCVFCAFGHLLSPAFQMAIHPDLYDVPMTLFEVILGVWLLFRACRIAPAHRAGSAGR